jgi:type II secretory pathway component GspD/PulD (secretin)
VVIQVLVAEVDFSSDNEFGVEIGLQSPVLFQRSIIPSSGFLGTGGSVNFTNAAGGLVPPGVTVNSTINPVAQPGFLFNQTIPLGNNPVVSPGVVGFQGLSNLGVGRASPTSGIGGFVFSAGSDSFNILVRALQTQGRIDILSRPQLQTTDNQTATINIGQQIPYIGSTTITATGLVTNSVDRTIVGVNLQVTPHISPDGTVMMRVTPQISSPVPTQVSLGNGILATAFNVQQVDTTVTAEDGQTVVIGGMISKTQQRNENKVPWLGDLPYLGSLFRYRTETKGKVELLVIMTPHIVRCRADADRVAAAESARMAWIRGNVRSIHETTGMDPIIHARDNDNDRIPGVTPVPSILPPDWSAPEVKPTPPEILPKPKPGAPAATPMQGAAAPVPAAPADSAPVQPATGVVTLGAPAPPANTDPVAAEPRKEKSGWSLWNPFRRN